MNPRGPRPDPDFDDKELQDMWQESTFPQPSADPAEIVRRIAGTVRQFDRKLFWRNFREYAAGVLMLIVFAAGAISGHGRSVSLMGVGAVSFVLVYLWWKHRDIRPLDPSADARAYQRGLIERYDRQIRLLRSARYWYFLPIYLWILSATAVNGLHRPPRLSPLAHAVSLAAGLLVVTAIFLWLIRLNERYAAGRLTQRKKEAEAMLGASAEQEQDAGNESARFS